MTWTERLRSTFNLFKNIAFPLYVWYLIYLALFSIMMIVFSLLPPVERFMQFIHDIEQMGIYNSDQVIPGDDLLQHLPSLMMLFVFIVGLGLIMTSFLYTGVYHLVVKGFNGRVFLRDFSLTDAKRMIGWNSFILLMFVGLFGLGVLMFALFSMINETMSFAFTLLFSILLAVISVFLIPWVLTGGYYILAYRELPFIIAFRQSWQFFRKNMFTLWGAALAMFIINIFIVLIQEISSNIGGLLSFIATPFFTLIPIVWTLTLISEQERLAYLDSHPNTIEAWPSTSDQAVKSFDTHTDSAYDESAYQDSSHQDSANDNAVDQYSTAEPVEQALADDLPYEDSPYHNEIEIDKSLPHYKPRKEDSPPGYYHTFNVSKKIIHTDMNFCPTCGTKLRSQAAYCSRCGIKLR